MVEAHLLFDGSNMCMQLCNQIPEGQGAALTGPFPVCPQPQSLCGCGQWVFSFRRPLLVQ